MLKITNYVRPQTLDEAYELCRKKGNVVLGGMLWLKMQNRTIHTAIDLCDLGLDKIEEKDDEYHIGAMVSLRALETHEGLNALTQGAFYEAVKHIVGVQFRNCATVGGGIYGRFGFSDVLTLFSVLDAKVQLHRLGMMRIEEFVQLPRSEHDILVKVIVPKRKMQVAYLSQRNTATDFPVVACALSYMNEKYTCAIGARPGIARVFSDDAGILRQGITQENAEAFGADIAKRAVFASNMRGSAEYRKRVSAVLVRRAALMLKEV